MSSIGPLIFGKQADMAHTVSGQLYQAVGKEQIVEHHIRDVSKILNFDVVGIFGIPQKGGRS
jgi:hypothetical protein